MKFYVDSADLEDVLEAKSLGAADGVTTNPTLMVKSGRKVKEVILDICAEIDGPVFAEVIRNDESGIVEEGREMAKWSPQVVVKIPTTLDGIRAARRLESEGITTGMTLIFSPTQALLAAKAGATYLIPFVGRLDDISTDGSEVIAQILRILGNYPELKSRVVAASIRHPLHILDFSIMGVEIVTAPVSVYKQLAKHPLTDIGIQNFLRDWQKANKEAK